MITIRTPFISPPLRSNNRMHWAAKAKITKQIRTTAFNETIKATYKPPPFPVSVTLIWEVTDKRHRDVGAAAPTLKAWIDGMVDSGLLHNDTHAVVGEERLRIEVGTTKGVRVEIASIERKDTTT